MHYSLKHVFSFLIGTLLLAGCSGYDVKETLGLNRKAPDEFKVVSRPPLSVPPEFTLRPPVVGESETEFGVSPRREAEEKVLGTVTGETLEEKSRAATADTAVAPVVSGSLPTTGESALLQSAGTASADPKIREIIQNENIAKPQAEDKTMLEKLVTLPGSDEPTVDAKGESDRIRQNKDENKPITEGETPDSKDKRNKGILGNFF